MRRRAASYAALTWLAPRVLLMLPEAFWPHEMRPYGPEGSLLPLPLRERAGVRGTLIPEAFDPTKTRCPPHPRHLVPRSSRHS